MNAVLRELHREIKELSRSAGFSQLSGTSDAVLGAIAKSVNVEKGDLDKTIDRVAEVATVIPLTREIVKTASFKEPSVRKAIGHRDIRAPFWTTNFEYFMLVLREGQTFPIGALKSGGLSGGVLWLQM